MAVYKCKKCGKKIDVRCKPAKCPKCGAAKDNLEKQ